MDDVLITVLVAFVAFILGGAVGFSSKEKEVERSCIAHGKYQSGELRIACVVERRSD